MTAAGVLVRDLSLRIDGRDVLSGVDLHLTERRIGIVGRNGSGKTSLAKIMAGLLAPDTGQVRIDSVDVVRDRRAALGVVGILFQNPDHQIIFPTVDEEMAFGLRQMGLAKEAAALAVRDCLSRFGKAHWQGASVAALSQGQKQLLCLMSVLAMAPGTILLDEPFAGLDIPTRLQLATYLEAVPARLVQISHEPEMLAGYERVIWLERGRVVQDGAAGPVLSAFETQMRRLGGDDDLSDLAG